MKAVICTRYGTPDVLKIKDIKKPTIKDDEMLIHMKASAVTSSDTYVRKLEAPGTPAFVKKQLIRFMMRVALGFLKPRSKILGMSVAGQITAIGKDIKDYKIGDDVYGLTGTRFGGYAEYRVVKVSELEKGEITKMPSQLNYQEAAALVYGGALAYHFMKPENIQAGDTVLIYGASGAVGTTAVQLAKSKGAKVTAVCSSSNFELMKNIGADEVLDYRDDQATNHLEKYDLVFDAVGAKKTSPFKRVCKEALTPKGKYISVDHALHKISPDDLNEIRKYADTGHLVPVIDKVYALNDIVKAHKYVDGGHKKGNVIIDIG